MSIQITIIGLGQIGASIGLALSEHSDAILRVGHDWDIAAARQARKIGAVDRVTPNLKSAVEDADLVLLTLPMDQIQEMMEAAAPWLKESAVVMDTAPIKSAVAVWAKELLPKGRSYVGLTPVLNPKYLHSDISGIAAAQADLFHDGMLGIVTAPGADSGAIKLAADLAHLLGAAPLFADLFEMDGLMMSTHVVPQLMSAALLNATLDQPGWREARKVAGRAYAEVTAPAAHLGEAGALAASALHSRENVLRILDNVMASLQALRDDIHRDDIEALTERLEHALDGRKHWWQARQEADWASEGKPKTDMPTAASMFGNMLGFGRKRKRD
ncbi:MAG: prephenate dehydrogenase/arogenate dehydrogenase family protein [Chloroflexi bacterium]|nr:prephenate dehydrogenase/arogenate dehydrogenase family protein [Chloroflexota bacterium]MBU1661880.1 prephenate dehydrogenase/arogenate dehydrogenase family protein [Chloroflexota bacterium]